MYVHRGMKIELVNNYYVKSISFLYILVQIEMVRQVYREYTCMYGWLWLFMIKMFLLADGPTMDTTMVFTLLSCRSTDEPILYTLSFTVSYGPPSKINCFYDNVKEIHYFTREDPLGLSREVIRSRYINSSYPDMTRVTLTLTAPRVSRSYSCTVTVEGRVNINNNNYNYSPMGSGTASINITGECVTAVLTLLLIHVLLVPPFPLSPPLPPPSPPPPPPPPSPPLPSQLQAPQQMSLLTGLVLTVLGFPGLLHQ